MSANKKFINAPIQRYAPKAPQALCRDAIQKLIDSGEEPSPENLLKLSKQKDAPLHAFFYKTPDSTWVQYGRYEAARRIIQSSTQQFVHGGKTITSRAIEFIRDDGEGRWERVEKLLEDPSLRSAYLREISRLLEQAQDKLARFSKLIEDD